MKTKFLCHVSRYDDHWGEREELSPDEPKRVVITDVVDLPFDDSVIDWFQDGEGYLECNDDEAVPEGGGFFWVAIGYSMDCDCGHNSVDFVWIESLIPATAEEVAEAKATTCAQVVQHEEARLQAGCAFYGHRAWYDEPPSCQKKGTHDGGSWPGCSRTDGQVCFDEDWKPLETARWAYPTNHFLDGTGVCKWAGQPYDPDFPGHELHPTPVEIFADLKERGAKRAVEKGVDAGEFEIPSLAEIVTLWDAEGNAAHSAGKIRFRIRLAKPWHTTYYVTPETARHYTPHRLGWMTCARCSGLPRYPGDCPFYEERPLARDEIILPVIYGTGWGRRYGWQFVVHELDRPEPRTRDQRISQPPVWGQWYEGSNAEGDIQMWTVVGIPVTGMGWSSDEPNGRPARVWGKLQFHERAFRKAKLTLDRLASEWRELHLVDDTVGEIILDNPGVMRAKTVSAVLTTLWRGLTNRACERWLRSALRGDHWGQAYSMFPWEMGEDGSGWPDKYSFPAMVRKAFKKKLEGAMFGWYPGRINAGTGDHGPILFPAVVVSRRLRWVYGLVGAPESIGVDGWHRSRLPEEKDEAEAKFVAAAGRRMTKDAYVRHRRSWQERYRKP